MILGAGKANLLIVGEFPTGVPHRLVKLYERAVGTHRKLLDDCWVSTNGVIPPLPSKPFVLVMGIGLTGKLLADDCLRWRGRFTTIQGHPGMVTLAPGDLLVRHGTPTHKGLRKPTSFTGAVMLDIANALRAAQSGVPAAPSYQHITDPTVCWFYGWVDKVVANNLPFAWDIETTFDIGKDAEVLTDELEEDEDEAGPDGPANLDAITRISFAADFPLGVSVPWTPEYLPHIRRLLESGNVKYGWNSDAFDIPTVAKEGIEVRECLDLMWLWHVYQTDLPMGLEFVSSFFVHTPPWKSTKHDDFAWYSAHDSAVTLGIANGLIPKASGKGLLPLYQRHIVELGAILRKAGQRGCLIDSEAQNALRVELEAKKAELVGQVQTLIPDHLLPTGPSRFKPKEGVRYREVPGEQLITICAECGEVAPKKAHAALCAGAKVKFALPVTKFAPILPFNIGSNDQMMAYARWARHPLGTNKKTGNPSIDKSQLKKLARWYADKHPLYQLKLDYAVVSKTLGTYVNGFQPDSNGLIHTTYTNTTSTMRLASRAVNLQNVSKHSANKLVKEVRRTIIVHTGNVFVQADSSAIEAVFVGYFAGSEDYIRLAHLGIHDYVCCQEFGWDFSETNAAKVKADHKVIRDRNKRVVHGSNYMMSPRLMTDIYPEFFKTEALARQAQERYFAACPDIRPWHTRLHEVAYQSTVLKNPWGYEHRFYDVYTIGVDGKARLGSDAKRVVAYLPQSSAGCFARDNLLEIGRSEWASYMPANVTVHDSYCLEVPTRLSDRAADYLQDLLTRPIDNMGGLRVGCEVEVGYNWKDMQTIAARKIVSWDQEQMAA